MISASRKSPKRAGAGGGPNAGQSGGDGRLSVGKWLFLWLMLFSLVLTVPGCSGCRPGGQTNAEGTGDGEEEDEPKEDVEVDRLYIQPSDSMLSRDAVKPGHYIAARQQMKANNFDFRATLESASVDRRGQPLPIDDTQYTMSMSRTAILPKGQLKNFETTYFVPRRTDGSSKTVWLQSRLTRSGREVSGAIQPTTRMPGHQFYLVVLASEPDTYGYLKKTASIFPPAEEFSEEDPIVYYRVVMPKIGRDPPLPSNALAWTTIAYLVWDEVDPKLLDLDQQDALLDWLHWGGQLIVSGPDSLDLLRGSFLDEYLPATAGAARELRADSFVALNDGWSMHIPEKKERLDLEVIADKPILGVELVPRAEAVSIPSTDDLVVERQIGAGRIVVTAFPLSNSTVVNWGSFDAFLNTCLLRRPPRRFEEEDGSLQARWAGPLRGAERDATLVSSLRYFSRDLSDLPRSPSSKSQNSIWRRRGFRDWSESGVGAWNDYSGVSNAVRDALKDAAGISIPKADFVFRVLAIYLVVLVPVNWVVFRVMNRVEWAWVAAPLIAIVGAIAVVRLAQLDIGFARSRTEVATLEIQQEYPRGHLSRYSALYTSLSTSYDMEFDDSTALAQPFPSQRGQHTSYRPVHFYQESGRMRLSGFQVDSNSTGMVHSEQMYDLGGPLRLVEDDAGGMRVDNRTDLKLQDAGVLRKTADGFEVAWLGELEPKTSKDLKFQASEDPYFDQWAESNTTFSYSEQVTRLIAEFDQDNDKVLNAAEFAAATGLPGEELGQHDANLNGKLEREELIGWSRRQRSGEISVGRLIDLASRQLEMREGEIRLVGWSEQELPGVNYRPRASQSLVRMVVLAHLRQAPLPEPERDLNCIQQKKAAADKERQDSFRDETS